MDQHPIPQDVTGFQFKLIGTMTVKQFGYVASGVVMAVILYYLPLPGIFGILIKVLLIPLLGGSGAFIAFVPIEGRPVDVMAGNFFKAVFSPNQYIYKKTGRKFSFSTITTTKAATATTSTATTPTTPAATKQAHVDTKAAQLQALLRSSQSEVHNALDQKELSMLNSLALPKAAPITTATAAPHPAAKPAQPLHTATIAPKPVAAVPAVHTAVPTAKPAVQPNPVPQPAQPTQSPTPSQSSQQKNAEEQALTQKESSLQQELQHAKQEETTTHTPAAHQKVTELEKQIVEIHTQKEQLEKEIMELKSQLTAQKAQPVAQPLQQMAPQPAAAAQPAQTQTAPQPTPVAAVPAPTQTSTTPPPIAGVPASQYAKTVPQTPSKKTDLPNISDTPNVVVGIVKDPRGNILPNMLVEVKDKDGNPVRAFKTNALGQFASATPLSPGVYTIELDDPKKQHQFDAIQITANNQIMLPIEIISHDAREELRRQLFN